MKKAPHGRPCRANRDYGKSDFAGIGEGLEAITPVLISPILSSTVLRRLSHRDIRIRQAKRVDPALKPSRPLGGRDSDAGRRSRSLAGVGLNKETHLQFV